MQIAPAHVCTSFLEKFQAKSRTMPEALYTLGSPLIGNVL